MLGFIHSFIHSFHWHVQNATIPCRSRELLPFLSVMYFWLPPFSTNYSSILSRLILPSISRSTLNLVVPRFIFLFSSIICTCPNQHNLFNFIVSIIVGFFKHLHKFLYWLISSSFLFHCHILGLKFFYTLFFQKCSIAFCLSLLVSKFLMRMFTFWLLCHGKKVTDDYYCISTYQLITNLPVITLHSNLVSLQAF